MAHALTTVEDEEGAVGPDGTVAFYDREALEYARATMSSDLTTLYPELLDRLPPGGLVLDAGSGSGRDILAFAERGFRVEAFDASAALAELASRATGVTVEVVRFEDWRAPTERYDGVWCFASLLHVARADLPDVVRRLSGSLRPGGWLFASFKHGGSDEVDDRGRRYTNVTTEGARRLFEGGGLEVDRVWCDQGPAALGGVTTWVYVLACRPG